MKFILASQSPRRKELLKNVIEEFETVDSNFDERQISIKNPKQLVKKLAESKCQSVYKEFEGERCVIGADTIVYFNNEIIGKPKNEEDAKRILNLLSGKTHTVYTGVSICFFKDDIETSINFICTSKVEFKSLSQKEIDDYILTKEPFGKAGAYAIQGIAIKFIKSIKGSYSNIMGLPVEQLYENLLEENLI